MQLNLHFLNPWSKIRVGLFRRRRGRENYQKTMVVCPIFHWMILIKTCLKGSFPGCQLQIFSGLVQCAKDGSPSRPLHLLNLLALKSLLETPGSSWLIPILINLLSSIQLKNAGKISITRLSSKTIATAIQSQLRLLVVMFASAILMVILLFPTQSPVLVKKFPPCVQLSKTSPFMPLQWIHHLPKAHTSF